MYRARHFSSWCSLVLVVTLVVSVVSPPRVQGQQKRSITEMDLFKFAWISDPQISPDGGRAAFVRAWVNQKSAAYESALWIVPTGGGPARQLTSGPRDSSPRWSPDGKQLAFVRSPEREGRPQPPQIYLLSLRWG